MKKTKKDTDKKQTDIPEFAFVAFNKEHDVLGIYLKKEDLPEDTYSFVCASII